MAFRSFLATLNRVVDADTLDMKVDLGFGIYHDVRVRLLHVDCPETNDSGGPEASQWVEQWFVKNPSPYNLLTQKKDGFGRWLGIVESHDTNLNDDLIESGHGSFYQY